MLLLFSICFHTLFCCGINFLLCLLQHLWRHLGCVNYWFVWERWGTKINFKLLRFKIPLIILTLGTSRFWTGCNSCDVRSRPCALTKGLVYKKYVRKCDKSFFKKTFLDTHTWCLKTVHRCPCDKVLIWLAMLSLIWHYSVNT